MRASGICFTLLLSYSSAGLANTIRSSEQTEAATTNTCLLGAISSNDVTADETSHYKGRSSVTDCLNRAFSNLTEDVEIEASFENASFDSHVRLTGTFTFDSFALMDGQVLQAELKSFEASVLPNEDSYIVGRAFDSEPPRSATCDLSDVERFSYTPSQNNLNLLKAQSLISIANSTASDGEMPAETADLVTTLEGLRSQLATASNATTQISLNCASNNLTMVADAGVADTVVTQESGSNGYQSSNNYNNATIQYMLPMYDSSRHSLASQGSSSRFSFSSTNARSTITINGQSMKVEASSDGNRTRASYEGIPLTVRSYSTQAVSSQSLSTANDAQSLAGGLSEVSYPYWWE